MNLLEREKYLEFLKASLDQISENKSLLFIITGEAGVGKTTLVEHFIDQQNGNARILWGACDALFTPRPLGPLYDIADQLDNELINLLNKEASRSLIFSTLLNSLQESKIPNLLVIEDIHWADESTLDLIKFLGRRINKSNSLIIITYRHDEIGSEHPLRSVLGDIPAKNVIRCKLPPLSEKITNNLAESHGILNLFQITGGNPFLITELINNNEKGIPVSIKDSIITRISRLSLNARELVELVSIIPTQAEIWVLNQLLTINGEILDECINSGILRMEHSNLSFKHELSRLAVEESLSESKKQSLNEKVLNELLSHDKNENLLSRIIHHAENAGNKNVIIEYVPMAASHASKLGAHNQAAALYKNALRFSKSLSPEKQLELYQGRAYECYLNGQIEEGITACEAVIELLKHYKDPYREAENYRKLSRLVWYSGEDKKGEIYLRKAINILVELPIDKTLAMAYSNLSQTYMLREDVDEAIQWGKTAVDMAEKINDLEIEVHALNNIGTVKMFAGDDSGEEYLKRSLKIAIENDFHDHVSRAYDNFGAVYISRRNLPEADRYYSKGIDYCSDKDLFTHELCMTGELSKLKLYSGKWDEAIDRANSTLQREYVPVIDRIIPLCVIGLIRARRNDPGVMRVLNEANSLVMNSGELGKIVTVKAAIAESYWLKNKIESAIGQIESVYKEHKNKLNPWAIGEMAFWLWKAGKDFEISRFIARPYLQQINGEWQSAAKQWEQLGCPYEQALALSDGDTNAVKKALTIFNNLGASAAAQLLKQKMREEGIRNIPKGPRQSTRENPAGLTIRQMEIIGLLKKGLSNNEIAEQLYISAKTVDHHVSAILSKLNIHSRSEAAALNIPIKNRE